MEIRTAGVIGFGFAGQLHAQALRSLLPDSKIVVFDTATEILAQPGSFGYEPASSLDDLLGRQPELIVTAVPPTENLALARRIVETESVRGVMFEKPLADTCVAADAIRRLMTGAGITSMVGLTGHGFHPEFAQAKALVEAGEIGDVHTIIEQIHQGGPDFPAHYQTAAYGGCIMELGIHTIDHLHYFCPDNDWEVVLAGGGHNHWNAEAPDWCETTLVSSSIKGSPIVAHASWAFVKSFPADMSRANYSTVLLGTKGKIIVYGFDGLELVNANGSRSFSYHESGLSTRNRHLPGIRAENEALIQIIREGVDSPVPLSYGVKLQQIADQIYNSIP